MLRIRKHIDQFHGFCRIAQAGKLPQIPDLGGRITGDIENLFWLQAAGGFNKFPAGAGSWRIKDDGTIAFMASGSLLHEAGRIHSDKTDI